MPVARCSLVVLAAAVVFAVLIHVHTAAAQGQRVTAMLDKPFKLAAGRSATIEGEQLQVGFDRVVSDSRCPKDAQCITAGEAIVRVWLLKAPGARENRELRTTPTETSAAYSTYRINLVALDPVPATSRAIRPSEYVATLTVSRSAAGEK